MRGLVGMRAYAPVCLDATHAAQFRGAGANASDGDRSVVARWRGRSTNRRALRRDPPDPENAQ
jgi:3-deoxy-D-manno-octulosonic acid (KDO) 8-phosphate synthase